MSFSTAGEHRVILQQYKFGAHQIYCICKILPDTVSRFGKEPENDFNWLTTGRWAKIENGLWRLFSSLTNWPEDARKLNNQMLIDHMQVSLSAAGEQLPAAQKLFQEGELPGDDIGLQIVIRYMSHEDRTTTTSASIPSEQPKQPIDDAKTSKKVRPKTVPSSSMKNRKKSKIIEPVATPPEQANDSSSAPKKKEKATKSAPKKTKLDKQTDSSSEAQKTQKSELRIPETTQNTNIEPSTAESLAPTKINRKRDRRSISQNSHNAKRSVEHTPPKRGRSTNRSKSPTARSSERRSARSLVRPSRYDEFVVGNKPRKGQSKNAESNVDSTQTKPKDSQATNGHESEWKCDQLDGAARANNLMELNRLLETPKPREVKILRLTDMNEAAVLKTFALYRPDFDRLFEERKHKYHTASYKGIDHMHILDILTEEIHTSMIKKLGEFYSKKGPHGTLVINGLLPLWVIRLFMDNYKLTQVEAISHISDQLKYYTHIRAVNNEPLCSDLEDF